jgi:hypothetical protein
MYSIQKGEERSARGIMSEYYSHNKPKVYNIPNKSCALSSVNSVSQLHASRAKGAGRYPGFGAPGFGFRIKYSG